MNLLPPNPTPFDYFHAIRALASREGSKAIFDLADAAMNLPDPKGDTPETDAAAMSLHGKRLATGGSWVDADFARTLERQRNELRAKYADHHAEAERLTRERDEWFSVLTLKTKELGDARAQRDALAVAGHELDNILPGNGLTAHPAVQEFRAALATLNPKP